MIVYKINPLTLLKDAGYSTYRLRREKILGEQTLQKFRTGVLPSWNVLDKLCRLTGVRIEDIVEYHD